MSDRRERALRVEVGALGEFADRIDVRSPAEFSLDHIPGATSHPVLDNAERVEIGTLYAASPFDARRRGAAKVSRNIAHMLDNDFSDKPRDWRPLIYCWRGGQRSRALQCGFDQRMDGTQRVDHVVLGQRGSAHHFAR